MAYTILVRPVDGGWSLRIGDFTGDLFFLDGGKAEESARAIADRLTASGQAADVEILSSRGSEAGEPAQDEYPTSQARAA